jgi:hypothetical protein
VRSISLVVELVHLFVWFSRFFVGTFFHTKFCQEFESCEGGTFSPRQHPISSFLLLLQQILLPQETIDD